MEGIRSRRWMVITDRGEARQGGHVLQQCIGYKHHWSAVRRELVRGGVAWCTFSASRFSPNLLGCCVAPLSVTTATHSAFPVLLGLPPRFLLPDQTLPILVVTRHDQMSAEPIEADRFYNDAVPFASL